MPVAFFVESCCCARTVSRNSTVAIWQVTHILRVIIFYQVLTPSDYKPDMSNLRLCDECELRRGDIIGSGAFGTVYKVRFSQSVIYTVLRENVPLHVSL